ncbi:MAG: hypothetical protein HOV68_21755 [Streptomycetaceae bacterium]|nr:hypothetical protein [Streptomycetaceae bacterium]
MANNAETSGRSTEGDSPLPHQIAPIAFNPLSSQAKRRVDRVVDVVVGGTPDKSPGPASRAAPERHVAMS